jgi:hypothetical protein
MGVPKEKKTRWNLENLFWVLSLIEC